MQSNTLPQRIWFLWFQGKANMPEIVEMCFESWLRHNPTWEVVFLDDTNLEKYIGFRSELNLNRDDIPLQAQSDIIRINLLQKFGGVWVDSTCYCNQPLDNWLTDKLSSGFFAFNRPNTDRMMSSWFLAAFPNNDLVKSYCDATNAFWQINPPEKVLKKRDKKNLIELVSMTFLASYPAFWHKLIVKKRLSFSHYFWFHYLFEHLYKTDKTFYSIWDETPKFSANIPHKLMHFGFNSKASTDIRNEIKTPTAPFFKLNWRITTNQEADSTLNILITQDKLKRDRQN